jgi:hypothetical protein
MAEEISNLKDDKSVCKCNDSSEDETDGAGVDCGLSLEKLNIGHGKKLLVLGLGGLLCHRVYRRDWSRTTFGKPDASYGNFFGRNYIVFML